MVSTISFKNKQKGFTIVELLIVIVVIGILATLVIVTFTGINQKARNSQRQTDLSAVASHLEKFFAETGSYPTLAQLDDTSNNGFVATHLKGLPADALYDPRGGTTPPAAAASATVYGYAVSQDNGDACAVVDANSTDQATTCTKFTLTANLEGGGTYVKKSN